MDSPDWSAADSDIYLPLRVGDPVAVELAYDRYGGMAFGLALRRDGAALPPPPTGGPAAAGLAGTANGSTAGREVLSDALSRSA